VCVASVRVYKGLEEGQRMRLGSVNRVRVLFFLVFLTEPCSPPARSEGGPLPSMYECEKCAIGLKCRRPYTTLPCRNGRDLIMTTNNTLEEEKGGAWKICQMPRRRKNKHSARLLP